MISAHKDTELRDTNRNLPLPVAIRSHQQPQRRHQATLETVPIEVQHQIIRLLPPKAASSIVPLVSRRLRFASKEAIPGCTDGEVAVQYSVVMQCHPIENDPTIGTSWRWNPVFDPVGPRFTETSAASNTIWASCTARVTLNADEVVAGSEHWEEMVLSKLVEATMSSGADQSIQDETLPPWRRFKLYLVKIDVPSCPFDWKNHTKFWDAMTALHNHTNNGANQVSPIAITLDSIVVAREEHEELTFRNVTHLTTGEYFRNRAFTRHSEQPPPGVTFARVLKILPALTDIRGMCLGSPEDASLILQTMSRRQRSLVRTLLVPPIEPYGRSNHSNYHSDPSYMAWERCPEYLFSTLAVFPNLTTFGVVPLGSLRSYDLTLHQAAYLRGHPGDPTLILPHLETIHLNIEAFSGNSQKSLPVMLETVYKWFEHALPNLKDLHLTMILVMERRGWNWSNPSVRATEDHALDLVGRLLRTVQKPGVSVVLHSVEYRDREGSADEVLFTTKGCSWRTESALNARRKLASRVEQLGRETGARVTVDLVEFNGQSGDRWMGYRPCNPVAFPPTNI